MNPADLRRRVLRLDQLANGFRRELTMMYNDVGPLSAAQRTEYRNALYGAVNGFKEARDVLAGVLRRLGT
jgi:hypothetical protein